MLIKRTTKKESLLLSPFLSMTSECAIPHCSSTVRLFSPRLGAWFCSGVCESHANTCNDYLVPRGARSAPVPAPALAPVDAPADVEYLELATVGNGVVLAPSTIVFADDGASIGLGLFAGRDFQAGQPITQYYGHIFKDSALPEDKLEHAIEVGGGWTIDGTRTASGDLLIDPSRQLTTLRAGGAAYANDLDYPRVTGMRTDSVRAPDGARTNARFRRVMDQETKARLERGESINKDEVAIFLEAMEFIPAGAEIFVSYALVAYVSVAPRPALSKRKQSAPKRRVAAAD